MPLSEREQQILREIEKNLHREDPHLAHGLGTRRPGMWMRGGIFLFLAGFATLIMFFVTELWYLGPLAYGAMVAAIVLIAGTIRSIVTSEGGARDRMTRAFERWEKRVRERYRKS